MKYASKVSDLPDLLVVFGETEDGRYAVALVWLEVKVATFGDVLRIGANPHVDTRSISLN